MSTTNQILENVTGNYFEYRNTARILFSLIVSISQNQTCNNQNKIL